MTTSGSVRFPFSAIVGMDGLGLALCLAAVGEHVGGVLVRGEKGTAKTTMVRGLAGSLGDIEKVAKVFVRNELIPLQDRMREVNAWAGQEVIRFKSYTLDTESD